MHAHALVSCIQEVSSVLYLTPDGGPTLVLEQKPSDPLAERGYLVQPCPNQLLVFKGDLLHGVLPGKHSNHSHLPSLLISTYSHGKA